MTVTYHVGDSRAVVAGIPDGSVDLIASSPPFLALRSYLPAGHEAKGDEIGSEANPAAFLDTLLGLTAEWGRVLAPHGSLAIELGDTYAGSGGAGGDYNLGGLREGQEAFNGSNYVARQDTKMHKVDDGSGRPGGGISNLHGKVQGGGPGWPLAKSLALIPQLYAIALAYGINPLTGQPSPAGRWRVRNVIVWHRPNPAVGALGDKVRPSTSYIVVATRSAKRWFDLTAVRTPHKGSYKEGEPMVAYRAAMTGPTAAHPKPSTFEGYPDLGRRLVQDPAGAPPLDAWFDYHDGTGADAPFHDTWTLTTQPSSLAHYAMWPAKLAERLILMMCPLAVCRVCGEPRRRIDKADPDSTAINFLKRDGRAKDGRGIGNTYAGSGGFAPVTTSTLGWTECGCLCFICRGDECAHDDHVASRYRPGLVLDGFAGTGTTLAVADLHGRDAIGIDIDERNRDIYPARYDEVKRALFGTPPPMPGQEAFDFAI